jgi:uncharacterized protein (DUF1800 family)
MVEQLRRRQPWQFLTISGLALALASSAIENPRALQFSSGPQPGVYEIVARHSDKCLSIRGASVSDGAQAIQWSCQGGDNQRWSVELLDDGYYHLVARHSGKALEVAAAWEGNGALVVQNAPHDGDNQKLSFESVGGGYYRLIARHSGKALEVLWASIEDDAAIIQNGLSDGSHQQWLLRAVSGPLDKPTSADAVRFLEQATFGPTSELVERVRTIGFPAFLDEQFQAPMSSYPTLPLYPTTRDTTACPNGSTCQRDNYTMYPLQNRFFVNALYGEDQLRQRVAFALHQILVVSGVEVTQPSWMAPYLQLLDHRAFGNYRDLLYDITLNPAMGNYLDVNGNTRTRPNENYAREILQLFSIGTARLNIDGTVRLDESGQPIPTYTQDDVNNFARVFTGWRFATAPATGVPNYIDSMVTNEPQHDIGAKTLLNGVTLPAGQSTTQDLNDAIDNIFNDSNVGPFISKQLIQHLVTSNPSPAYVARVASVFNGGSTPRGDLKAVVRAILLDPEARGDVRTDSNYGRLRHPAQFIANILRAFNARSADGMTTTDGYLNPQSVAMGMDVFRPPSVFSYFSPFTVIPGTAGVRGPEFGIFSTSTALRRLNFVNTMVFSRINVGTNAPSGTSLDFTPLLPLAPTPSDLVDALDDLLLHGSMTDDVHLSIEQAVAAVASSNPLKRVRTAVYLVLTSSQYQVER